MKEDNKFKDSVNRPASRAWVVKRHVVEEYEVWAATKKEAKLLIEDPSRVTVTKETITLKK